MKIDEIDVPTFSGFDYETPDQMCIGGYLQGQDGLRVRCSLHQIDIERNKAAGTMPTLLSSMFQNAYAAYYEIRAERARKIALIQELTQRAIDDAFESLDKSLESIDPS